MGFQQLSAVRAQPDPVYFQFQLATAIPCLEDVNLMRSVAAFTVQPDSIAGWEIYVHLDAEFFANLARLLRLQFLHLRRWSTQSLLEHVPLTIASFSALTTLCLGRCDNARLMVSGFFELLSMMPALKVLAFGTLDYPVNLDRDADTFDSYSASLALTPACSLTHLIVLDDSDVNFKHYPQLLSRSHHTLEHIELHRIYDLGVADGLRATLQHCTRLRHLALEANSFANERIISACPRLQSLSLSSAPTASEMAALHALLRALELAIYYSNTVTPEQFVAHTAWKRLRVILGYATSLSTIRFDLMGQQLQHETEEYSIANCALYARRGVSTSLPCLQDA